MRNEQNGLLIVEVIADGTPVGTVSWHEVRYGPNPESAALNFGIELIADARGHGYGTDAQVLLTEYLFSQTTINRLEAGTDVENIPEQRSLEKAGFRREGIARGCPVSCRRLSRPRRLREDPRRLVTAKLARSEPTIQW